jgi:hypothetical protein
MHTIMAPPKKRRAQHEEPEGDAKGKKKRKGTLVQLYLDDLTLSALDTLRNAQRFPPERTQVTLRALMELLEREGHWPPKRD